MRATEIEVEEKEVEHVYCDECGDDCTDDHEYEPREVCPSCADGRSTWKDFKSLIDDFSHSDNNESITVDEAILAVVILPVVLFAAIGLAMDGEYKADRNDALAIVAITIGSTVWTSLLWALLVF